MANIIKTGNTPKYRFTCKKCKTSAEYDVWEIKEYEDCYDDMCIEYRCPVCGKFNSIHKSDLDKHRVMYVENSDKSRVMYVENSDKSTHSVKERRIIKDIIMIVVSVFVGFIGAMLLISIF